MSRRRDQQETRVQRPGAAKRRRPYPSESKVSIKLPKVAFALFALQGLLLTALYYNLHHSHQTLGACQVRFARLQSMRTELTDTNAKLEKSEAALAAAEARLERGKR
jgi:hypothetical protein